MTQQKREQWARQLLISFQVAGTPPGPTSSTLKSLAHTLGSPVPAHNTMVSKLPISLCQPHFPPLLSLVFESTGTIPHPALPLTLPHGYHSTSLCALQPRSQAQPWRGLSTAGQDRTEPSAMYVQRPQRQRRQRRLAAIPIRRPSCLEGPSGKESHSEPQWIGRGLVELGQAATPDDASSPWLDCAAGIEAIPQPRASNTRGVTPHHSMRGHVDTKQRRRSAESKRRTNTAASFALRCGDSLPLLDP